jgi:hypothetical protein
MTVCATTQFERATPTSLSLSETTTTTTIATRMAARKGSASYYSKISQLGEGQV